MPKCDKYPCPLKSKGVHVCLLVQNGLTFSFMTQIGVRCRWHEDYKFVIISNLLLFLPQEKLLNFPEILWRVLFVKKVCVTIKVCFSNNVFKTEVSRWIICARAVPFKTNCRDVSSWSIQFCLYQSTDDYLADVVYLS